MKRGVNVLFLLVVSFILSLSLSSAISVVAKDIPGKIMDVPLTGKVTTQLTSLKIYVGTLPALNIITPKNATYMINESIPFNYSVSNAETVWYSLDNSSAIFVLNISSLIYLNVTDGSHVLWMYANNSYGLSVDSVMFVANSTRFIILYVDDYKNVYSGVSTDFYAWTYEEVQNLSDICLEDIRYGKICFDDPINVINDRINNDNIVDVQGNSNILLNNLGVDSVELPNFNFSATIWIYNLTFVNPRILRDGAICGSDICTFEDYSNGTLRFHVTRFSNYSAEETPTEEETPGGSGGGGGNVVYPVCRVVNESKTPGKVVCDKCNPPYIMYGDKQCCLDRNNNSICDMDEVEVPQTTEEKFNWYQLLALLFALMTLVLLILLIRFILLAPHRRRKHRKNYVSHLRGMRVYSSQGNYLGDVREVYLKDNQIYGISVIVKPHVAEHLERPQAMIRKKHIISIKDVIIVDETSSDYLEKLNVK